MLSFWTAARGAAFVARSWSEVRRVVAWLPRRGGFPACDLVRAVTAHVDDHDLVVLLADPDVLADVGIRHRIFATLELNDRHVGAHTPRHTEDRCERLGW